MKIQPLYDLQQEINRLFIAGSKFATGDVRLSKHVAAFNKLGEKAPVFKKMATDLEDLVAADSRQAAEKLMDLSGLLYAVLYTQGEDVEEDVTRETMQPAYDIAAINTNNSYLQLKPVIEALTISKPGRLEVVKDALAHHIFSDFRIYQHINTALADKYAELADYIIDTVIPAAGSAMIPFLEKSFAYEDKTEHVRRLRALDILGYEKMDAVIEKILSGNLPALQAEAIRIKGKDSNNEALILNLANDKNKVVREAAYHALAGFNTIRALEKLKEVYTSGKNTQGVVSAIAVSSMSYFFTDILEQYNKYLQTFAALPKDAPDKEVVEAFGRLESDVVLFKNKDREEVYALLENLVLGQQHNELINARKTLLSYSLNTFIHNVTDVLGTLSNERQRQFFATVLKKIRFNEWLQPLYREYYRFSVRNGDSRAELSDKFMEPFIKGYIDIGDVQQAVFYRHHSDEVNVAPNLKLLDDRWLKLLLQKVSKAQKWDYDLNRYATILHVYEPPDNTAFNRALVQLVEKFSLNEIDFAYEMLLQRKVTGSYELIFRSLQNFKSKNSYFYSGIGKQAYWKTFPKEYASKIRALYDRQKINLFLEIADAIEYQ